MLAQHKTKQYLHYVHSPARTSILVTAPNVGIQNKKVRYLAAIFIQLNQLSRRRKIRSDWSQGCFHSGVRVASIEESFLHIINEVSTPRKWSFWFYFSSLHDYWHPCTWNTLIHTSWGEMERCEKRVFQLLKMRKKRNLWNIKTNCVTDFLLTGGRVWRIILVITGW